MPPHHLDVNVHPTKKEVHFLNEDELLIRIHRSITEVLKGSNESRTFAVANNSSLDSFMLKESTDDSNLVEHDENVNNFTDASTEYAPQKVRNENMIDRNEYEESEEIHSDGFIADDTLSVSKSEASLGSKRKLIFAQSESVVKAQPYRPNKLVRTDPTLVAIDSIFRPVPKERFKESAYEDFNIKMVTAPREREETVLSNKYCLPCTRQNYNTNHGVPLDGPCICCIPGLDLPVTDRIVGSEVSNESSNIVDDKALEVFLLPETNCSFDSVRELLMHLKVHRSSKLKEILSQSTFVGAVDRCRSLVQFKTSLLMIDHEYLLNHLFYQLTLRQFGVMGRLQLATPVPIKNFVLIAINAVEDMKDSSVASSSSISAMDMEERKTMAETVQELLIEKSAMLDDYFAIKISEDGQLHYLPLLLPNYTPEPSLLPYFLLRLATEIDWDGEKQCFNSIAGTIAWYYSQLSDCGVDGESSTDNSRDSRLDLGQVKLSQSIRNSLFPAVKRYLFTPDLSGNDSVVVEVTTLEKLYKVFERC